MKKITQNNLLGISAKNAIGNLIAGVSGLIINQNTQFAQAGDKQVTFKNVLNDTHVSACVQARKAAVLNYNYEIRCDDKNIKEFCEKVISNIGYVDLVLDIMEAIFYGYSVLEIYYWYDTINHTDNLIPSKIVLKPNEWFEFDVNGMCRLKNTSGEAKHLPYRKFLIVQHKPTYNNPYGEAVLSKCLSPVVYKSIDMAFWLRYIERFGMPHFVGKTEFANDIEAVTKMQENIEDLIQDASTVISKEEDIDSLNPGSAGQANQYLELIKYCNDEISKAILSQTLTTELSKSGSYAAANTHFQVYQQVTENDVQLVQATINKLLKWVIELNFHTNEYPEILIFPKEDVDRPLAEVTEILSRSGSIKFTKKFYTDRFGFADDEFDIVDTPEVPKPMFNIPHSHSDFETSKNFDDQLLIDEVATRSIAESDDLFVNISKQIIDFINSSKSYEEVKENIHKILPELDTEELEEKLLSAMFLSSAIGSLSVKDENSKGLHNEQ